MLPPTQTFIGKIITKELKKSTNVDINVEKIAVSVFGGVKLKNVLIKDHHQDTLIYSKNIQTKIANVKKLISGDFIFGNIKAENLTFYLKTYKNEEESNINIFVKKLENDKPKSDKPFILKSKNIQVVNGHFKVENQNKENPISVEFKQLNTNFDDFSINADIITAKSNLLSFAYHTGVFAENITGKIKYSKNQMYLIDTTIKTKQKSNLKGNIIFDYQEGDLADFTDKVIIDVNFNNGSRIATNDINCFYPELEKNKIFNFSTKAKGTLNDFSTENLFLSDEKMVVNGDLDFKNITAAQEREFSISGNITEIKISNKSLKDLLPRVLEGKLPQQLDRLENVILNGKMRLTKTELDIKSKVVTKIGNITTDLKMQNITDQNNTTYQGNINLRNFDLGKFFNTKSVGKINANLNTNGKGFTQENLDSTVEGNIASVFFNNYNYHKILINGKIKESVFNGEIHIDDNNVKLSFDGLFDVSSKIKNYNFKTQVDYADLSKIKLIQRDTFSIFKGDITFVGQGNSIDEIVGKIDFIKASYQNQNDIYFFDDFQIVSELDNQKIRTIRINSPDIIEGNLIGRFNFDQFPKIVQNALGSLYTNYSPFEIQEKQFLRFNFSIYNKIVEVFFPEISLGKRTFIRGNINPDQELFKLNFSSPNLRINKNEIHNINFQIDTQNPLFSAYIEIDSLTNNLYKISDFRTINVKHNDTLYFKTECNGSDKDRDSYNLNLYYTIDKDKNSVFGFQKSELNFKNNLWYINEENRADNRVVFNKSINDLAIENFIFSHKDQFVQMGGIIKGKDFKDLELNFKNVDLSKITPEIDKLPLEGILNGNIHFMQNKNKFRPTSSLEIMNLTVNEINLGDLTIDAEGDQTLSKFGINAYLYKDDNDVFSLEGDLQTTDKQTFVDLDIRTNKLNLNAFSEFGAEVITNIRGSATGRTTVTGNLKNPQINGRMFLDNAGMKIAYLNTDFDFDNQTIIDITEKKILLGYVNLTDIKHNTKSILSGTINHKLFSDWILDLSLNSDRMLILDTEDSEDTMYYGTAFIRGTATIQGPTSGLIIKADVTSLKGTQLYIPVGNTKSNGEVSHVKFLTAQEKYNSQKISENRFITKGLELKINLNVTPDATIDIIINKDTGHAIRKGKGNGILEMDINTLGSFTMNGIFTVEEGKYDFRYGGFIKKEFSVEKGGTITWSGNPLLANINIKGIYSTEANPAVLLDNPSFNRKIPINVIIDVKGTLEALEEPDFDIIFPSVSSVLQSEIQYKLSDLDTRRTQAFSLLLSRNFMGEQGMSSGSAFAGSLTETASSLFNNFVLEDSSIFRIGVDYNVANRDPNRTRDIEDSDRLGVNFSAQINEKITFNGKLGVPIGGTQQSSVVGNAELQLQLNQDRTFNARAFNRENDVNYFGEDIGYTQGIGLTWNADFDSFDELLGKIFSKKKKQKTKTETIFDIDSEFNREYQEFIKRRGQQRNSTPKKEDEPEIERVPDPF